jgi:hypothetical protein
MVIYSPEEFDGHLQLKYSCINPMILFTLMSKLSNMLRLLLAYSRFLQRIYLSCRTSAEDSMIRESPDRLYACSVHTMIISMM